MLYASAAPLSRTGRTRVVGEGGKHGDELALPQEFPRGTVAHDRCERGLERAPRARAIGSANPCVHERGEIAVAAGLQELVGTEGNRGRIDIVPQQRGEDAIDGIDQSCCLHPGSPDERSVLREIVERPNDDRAVAFDPGVRLDTPGRRPAHADPDVRRLPATLKHRVGDERQHEAVVCRRQPGRHPIHCPEDPES